MAFRSLLAAALLLFLATCALASDARTIRDDRRWLIDTDAIRIVVDPLSGSLSVRDKTADYLWRQPAAFTPAAKQSKTDHEKPTFREVRPLAAPQTGLTFQTDFGSTEGKPNTCHVTFEIPPDLLGALAITLDMPDRNVEAHWMPFFEPFLLDTPRGVMAVADYCNGHVYPVDDYPFKKRGMPADRLDMPWVGLCDLDKGFGWLMIIDTSDNGHVDFRRYPVGKKELVAPKLFFVSSKRTFAYPRRVTYHFLPKGGYVAIAKTFRAWAKQRGLLVTLAEKVRRNANVQRLFGAPIVWGCPSDVRDDRLRAPSPPRRADRRRRHDPADGDLPAMGSRLDSYLQAR